MAIADHTILARFSPLDTLSPGRLKELAALSFVEKIHKGLDPFRLDSVKPAQAIYLLSGKLGLRLQDGTNRTLLSNSEATQYAIKPHILALHESIALTDIEIIRIDLDLLDIMMTWDELIPTGEVTSKLNEDFQRDINGKMDDALKNFNWAKFRTEVFRQLPATNIENLFNRMVPMQVLSGQVIIQQGNDGDFYYLIIKGEAKVCRVREDGVSVVQALLGEGETFGEEALAADIKRNATVSMQTDGQLLRLKKSDFIELLKQPLISYISMDEIYTKLNQGAILLDVRLPSEFKFNSLPRAINIPLNQLRESINEGNFVKGNKFIVYCSTGRRSSAAAFILIQKGFDAVVLHKGHEN